MSNIYENTSNINNVSTSQRKRIFSSVAPPTQSQNLLQVPKQEQQKFSLNTLNIDPELSYIAPVEMEQKQASRIEDQIKSEIRQEQTSQQDPAKQSLLKDVQLENLENILTLFRSTVPMNSSNIQGSRIANSTIEPQFYQQLEIDAESIRDQIKKEGRTVHTIIEKQSRIKQQRLSLITQLNAFRSELQNLDNCTSFTKFSKEIRYTFNQFESKADELRDLFNESFNFMSVVSVAAYEKLQQPFNEFETITDSEFTSFSLKFFSLIEMQAKEFEITLSEKRRLGNINQNHQQYKSACQKLLQLIKSYPEVEQSFQTQMTHLQRISSIYFKGLSQDIQNNLSHYQQILQDYRLSLAMIEKIALQREIIQDHFDSFDYYRYLICYLNQQPQNYIDNYYQLKYSRDELRKIEYKQTKYFMQMKNKIFYKCCLFVETIQHQIKVQKAIIKRIIPLIDIYQNHKSQDYKCFFEILFQNLKQNITKEQWLHLINLFQEIQNQKFKLKQVLLKLKEINQHHPTLNEFKERFVKLINIELNYIDTLYSSVQPYLGIHDIDAYIQYIQFKDVYENQKEAITQKIQEIILNLPQQLLLTDIDSQNLRKIAIEKLFSQTHQLESTASKLQKKKVQSEIDQIKQELQHHLIFEKDVICLLEQMQYLHRGNLVMIVEDFSEMDQKNNNSSLQQLIEVTTESYKKIETIKDERLLDVKQVQVQGFKWILNLFLQFDNFRKSLVDLIFQNHDEQQIEFQRTISLVNFEEFIQQNRFSHLFYTLNQYPRKYQHWIQIKNELSKVIIQSFKISFKKVMDKIDILGGDKPLTSLQFDQDNIEKILRWFALEQHHSEIAKGIILYQGYRKIKVMTSQFSQQNQQQDSKSKLMVDLQNKMFEVTNKLRDQLQELKPETKFALHISVETLLEEELDKIIYTELQEEWVIDHLEKGIDFSFLADLSNNLGVFDSPYLNQSLLFLNINQILKTQSEIDVKQIRSTLLNAIKHQT